MSSLWTPGGEHRVPRSTDAEPQDQPAQGPGNGADEEGPPDEAALRAEIDEARARVAEVPAEVVVLNHAMGLYELAAIHLSASPPNLPASALAIDAFACLVEGLGDRMGPDAGTLRDALAQIRMAFVQIKQSSGAGAAAEGPAG